MTCAIRVAALAAAGFAASLVTLPQTGCVWKPPGRTQTAALRAPHVEAGALEVRTRNGEVAVHRGGESEVLILAHLRMTSDERLEGTTISANRQEDGVLLVEAIPPDGQWRGSEGCGFEITIPDVSAVTVSTGNGRIEVQGIGGRANLRTSNGPIVVRDHGGEVKASTSNGRIEVLGAGGPVDASTSNGAVKVRLAEGCEGPVRTRTSNGSITLQLSEAFKGTLTLRTSNGSIVCPKGPGLDVRRKGRSAATLTVGEGGGVSEARTSNGRITVVRANDPI